MTTQSEPNGGAWQDRRGDVWAKWRGKWEAAGCKARSWAELCGNYGPLIPLIPDPGWEQDGEPVVCRVVSRGNGTVAIVGPGPTGSTVYVTSATLAASYGLPIPPEPEPEPSLADQLMNDVVPHIGGGKAAIVTGAAARLRELEANYQSVTSEAQSGSRPSLADRECDGRCTTAGDLGASGMDPDMVAYPDPWCSLHGVLGEMEPNADILQFMVGEHKRAADRLRELENDRGFAPWWVEAVRPDEIPKQRERGWPDFHPEDFCHRCGHRNPVWSVDGPWPFSKLEDTILCPSCYARQIGTSITVAALHENDGEPDHITAEGVRVPAPSPNYQSATNESQSSSKLDGEGAGVEASASGADSRSPASEMRTEAVPFLSPEPPFFPFDYSPRELIQVAMGAASMCWENPGGAGVFDSDRASFIADELCERLGIGDPDTVPVYLSREQVGELLGWSTRDIAAAARAALEANPGGET